ncbi:MAG: toxin [Chlorobium sp.]|nr:toxin [Chlorobium sp.]
MDIDWSTEKNDVLKRDRGLDLEILAESIESGDVLEVALNPNYPGQVIFMILVGEYVCAVPAVPTEDGYFLKTAYKSRKLNKRFNGGD